NIHPRFWGWVQGNGTPLGMMADMLAAGINPHMAGFDQAPALVEHRVIAWLAGLLGLPAETTGLMGWGATMANTLALAIARQTRDGEVFYGSSQTHSWAPKSAKVLGMGREAFVEIPVTPEDRIDLDALRRAITKKRPFAIIGTAGTVNTG